MTSRILFSIFCCLILFSTPALSENLSTKSRHWNFHRGYEPFEYSTPRGIEINNLTDSLLYDYYPLETSALDLSLTFRSNNFSGNPSKKYNYFTPDGKRKAVRNPMWGFFILSENDTLVFSIEGKETVTGIETTPASEIKYRSLSKNSLKSSNLSKGINPYEGDNIWSVNLNETKISLAGGDKGLTEIFSLSHNSGKPLGFGFIAGWGSHILISDLNAEFTTPLKTDFLRLDTSDLDSYLKKSEDSMEGYWTIFDRELEESLLKMGGLYVMACVKEGDDYYLVYLEGASINKKEWTKGDIKAILRPSPFPDIYDVEWFDSQKESLKNDIKAQKGEGTTLLIQFPYQASKLRLRKISG